MTDERMESTELFLDEAGYTGPDLVNQQQPVFVLASTVIEEAEARRLLDSCFGVDRQTEVKHSTLCRSRRGRSQIINFFRHLAPDSRKVAFFGVHKEYVLLAFLIDFWLEPLMRHDGLNLYDQGANIALVNVSYLTLGATLGPEGRREFLRRFQVMTRDRTAFAYESFWHSLRQAVREHDLIENALGPLLLAERRLGWRHLVELPADLLDLGDYGLLETLKHWQKELPGRDFVLFHDRSAMIERHRARWEAILDPSNPPAVVGQDRRTTSFPFPVRGLRTEDSQEFAQLQVVDLVAGAARALMSARATGYASKYADVLDEVGLLHALFGRVWPSDTVTPQELETEGPVLSDAAEFIAELLRRYDGPLTDDR